LNRNTSAAIRTNTPVLVSGAGAMGIFSGAGVRQY